MHSSMLWLHHVDLPTSLISGSILHTRTHREGSGESVFIQLVLYWNVSRTNRITAAIISMASVSSVKLH